MILYMGHFTWKPFWTPVAVNLLFWTSNINKIFSAYLEKRYVLFLILTCDGDFYPKHHYPFKTVSWAFSTLVVRWDHFCINTPPHLIYFWEVNPTGHAFHICQKYLFIILFAFYITNTLFLTYGILNILCRQMYALLSVFLVLENSSHIESWQRFTYIFFITFDISEVCFDVSYDIRVKFLFPHS